MLKEKRQEILFWTLAVLVLFTNLGVRNIAASEGRWACVVREMFVSGDFWHPTVNFYSYFDKPLGSYWIIAFFALFNKSVVNELIIRLPSALAALALLGTVRFMARRLWNDARCTTAASWILLTCYGFVYWGRLGEADMLNLLFSTLAVAWYLHCRKTPGFLAYLLFGVLCAFGGQTKGMSAIAVPVAVVLADILLDRTWKTHLNWKLPLAAIISFLFYLLPFALAAKFGNGHSENGLALAFKENVVRFFDAFDHDGPWYSYFGYLPRLLIIWTPFLVLALGWAFASWRKLDEGERWIAVSVVVIFVLFSLSESKRVYYILPILPYCALLMGRFMSDTASPANPVLVKIRNALTRVLHWVLLIAVALLLVLLLAGFIFAQKDILTLPMLLMGPCAILVLCAYFLSGLVLDKNVIGHYSRFFRMSVLVALLFWAGLGIYHPFMDAEYRTGKRFFTEIRRELDERQIPVENVAFFEKRNVDATWYLGYDRQIRNVSEEEIRDFISRPNAVLIVQRQCLKWIKSDELLNVIEKALWRQEPEGGWFRRSTRTKYNVYLFNAKTKEDN